MAVLVTGGAGYIGSATVRLLREHGREVVVLDSMEFGHRAAVGDVPLVKGDVGDSKVVAETVEQYGIDSVVHFAAYKSPGESMIRPQRYFANNVAASTRLLETLHEVGVGRLVFSSTCAVYGTPERVPVGEDAPVRPESPYGESKAMTERALSWYDRCLDLRSVSLRYFNAAGAWPDGSIGEDWTVTINLIPLLMKAVLGRRGPLEVYGNDYPTPDRTAIRDYVHVIDLAEAHVKALEYLEGGGEYHRAESWHGRGLVGIGGTGRGRAGYRSACSAQDSGPSSRGSRGALCRRHAVPSGAGLGGPTWTRRHPDVGVVCGTRRTWTGTGTDSAYRCYQNNRRRAGARSDCLEKPSGVLTERCGQALVGIVECLFVIRLAHCKKDGLQTAVSTGEVSRRSDDRYYLGAALLERPWIIFAKHLGQSHDRWNPLSSGCPLRTASEYVNRTICGADEPKGPCGIANCRSVVLRSLRSGPMSGIAVWVAKM